MEQEIQVILKWYNVIGYGLDVWLDGDDYLPLLPKKMVDAYDKDMRLVRYLGENADEAQCEAFEIMQSHLLEN